MIARKHEFTDSGVAVRLRPCHFSASTAAATEPPGKSSTDAHWPRLLLGANLRAGVTLHAPVCVHRPKQALHACRGKIANQ